MMCRRRIISYGVCWLLLTAGAVRAQHAPEALEAAPLASTFQAGVLAFETGLYGQAEALLAAVFQAEPAFFEPDHGSAAYWLGRTYQAINRPDSAAAVWQEGWDWLIRGGAADLRLADAFIVHVFERQDSARYAAAAEVYLALLERLEGDLPAGLHALRGRHLGPLALILPDDVREEAGLPAAPAARTAPLPEGAAGRLLTWWRRMDALPATRQNERVVEHLARIAYAHRHYRDETTPTGLDDRGPVYIRFGPPSHRKEIIFDEARYIGRLSPAPTFVKNEFWVYRHVHDTAQYLFVRPRQREGYRLGLPRDLLPSTLRSPRRTRAMLEVMEHLYRDLALYHQTGHYGFYYNRIANYAGDLAMAEFGATAGPSLPPFSFVQTFLGEVHIADDRAARERDEHVPPSFTNVLDEVDLMPVALRWARFLAEDGTTRTELYWSLHARDLYPSRRVRRRLRKQELEPSDDYVLTVSATRLTDDYRVRARYRKPHRVHMPRDSMQHDAILQASPLAVHGDTGPYALAVQWDAYWAVPDDTAGLRMGPKLKTSTYWIDTLEALNPDPDRLEMSDLKPLRLINKASPLEAAPAYPGAVIAPETRLALYFEVYHLTPAADGRTHYRVAYRAAHDGRGGGLLRLRDGEARTTAETRYSGRTRTAHETVELDLSAWKGAGTLQITVHVTDETTGEAVERTLSFELQPELNTW